MVERPARPAAVLRDFLSPCLALLGLVPTALAAAPWTGSGGSTPAAGEPGGPGLAIRASKVLTAAWEGPQVIDDGRLLIRDGRIEAVGRARELAVPEGYEELDVGGRWLMPGMVELHNHVGSGQALFVNDINDTVYMTNPGLRASTSVRPENPLLKRGLAGGVTTALYIPGSGSNMGGQGVLLKIGRGTYEEMEVRNPGSLKLAQAGNPEGWVIGVTRTLMNWNTRNTFLRGLAYARRWEAFEQGRGERPAKDPQWEVFRDLHAKRTQVSTHTQIYQVVLMTITMVRMELGLDVYIDHGSFDGFRTAELAEEQGVPAILGPRAVVVTTRGVDTDGRILGMAAGYQERGHTMIGFNTDCVDNGVFITPPQEELQLQAGMAVRYGLDVRNLESVRGLTIVPARTAGLGDRLGSLEPGKDADVVVIGGDPADPRNAVERVYTDGRLVYDAAQGRRW